METPVTITEEKIKARFGQEFALFEDANARMGFAMLGICKATIEAEYKCQQVQQERDSDRAEYNRKVILLNEEVVRLNAQLDAVKLSLLDHRKKARAKKRKAKK